MTIGTGLLFSTGGVSLFSGLDWVVPGSPPELLSRSMSVSASCQLPRPRAAISSADTTHFSALPVRLCKGAGGTGTTGWVTTAPAAAGLPYVPCW
ncbi:hypothetical protein ACFU5Z_30585 [Streptomyces sp. NPDC057521]|uniref:hypothetical protein n=1 Tax=Streptomyces sp. NPDC057521 TaxID=3346156 RepID=UPI0036C32F86